MEVKKKIKIKMKSRLKFQILNQKTRKIKAIVFHLIIKLNPDNSPNRIAILFIPETEFKAILMIIMKAKMMKIKILMQIMLIKLIRIEDLPILKEINLNIKDKREKHLSC